MYYMEGDNYKFESAAIKILLLKDPRCCKIVFGDNYNFTTIYAYALGIASSANDYRILDAIKYRKKKDFLGATEDNYKGTDKENIKEFFDYFNDSILSEIRRYDCKREMLLSRLDFSREEQIVKTEEERQKDLEELQVLLEKVPGSYSGFIYGMMIPAQHSYRRCKALIRYIKENPLEGTDDIIFFADSELGFSQDAHVVEPERFVDFESDIEVENYDSLGRWLCISNPSTGYGLFSKDVWTSDELLPILEKYV